MSLSCERLLCACSSCGDIVKRCPEIQMLKIYFDLPDIATISWDVLRQFNTSARGVFGASTSEHGAGSYSNKGFYCTQCLKVYRHRSNLLRHIRLECGKEPIFHCPYCQHRSKRKGNLMIHIRNLHRKDMEKLDGLS